jgi:hypothetical protein
LDEQRLAPSALARYWSEAQEEVRPSSSAPPRSGASDSKSTANGTRPNGAAQIQGEATVAQLVASRTDRDMEVIDELH